MLICCLFQKRQLCTRVVQCLRFIDMMILSTPYGKIVIVALRSTLFIR
jgi:hypothetical protein